MPATTRTAVELSDAMTAPRMRWTVWPLVDRPGGAVAMVLLMALAGFATAYFSRTWYWGPTAVGAIAIAMWRFFLPITFEVTLRGLKQESLMQSARTAWSDVRAIRKCSGGVLLLASENDTPLDALRGLFLPWGPHRAELLHLLALYVTGEEDVEQ